MNFLLTFHPFSRIWFGFLLQPIAHWFVNMLFWNPFMKSYRAKAINIMWSIFHDHVINFPWFQNFPFSSFCVVEWQTLPTFNDVRRDTSLLALLGKGRPALFWPFALTLCSDYIEDDPSSFQPFLWKRTTLEQNTLTKGASSLLLGRPLKIRFVICECLQKITPFFP